MINLFTKYIIGKPIYKQSYIEMMPYMFFS